jgi:hypothetical protein
MLRGLTLTGGSGRVIGIGGGGGHATLGGGIFCWGASPTIESCVIRNNVVFGERGEGSAVACRSGAQPLFRGCAFIENEGDVLSTCVDIRDPGSAFRAEGCRWERNHETSLPDAILFAGSETRSGAGGGLEQE